MVIFFVIIAKSIGVTFLSMTTYLGANYLLYIHFNYFCSIWFRNF